jgi:hypothetical protein
MRPKNKGNKRRINGFFYPMPCALINSENFQSLSPMATKVFLMILAQIRFYGTETKNNGDLNATFTTAQKWHIGSKQTLRKALNELLERGMIEQTREVLFSATDKNRPNLYGITYWAIDECNGKVTSTNQPSAKYMNWQPKHHE